jgi:acyl dehydratase
MSLAPEPAQKWYLDDLRVGQRFNSGSYRMDEDRMKAFAAEFDPQPFHLDDAAHGTVCFAGSRQADGLLPPRPCVFW